MIDLHVHTTRSDGQFEPSEVIKLAKSQGLKAIAITDHDTIDGIEDAVNAGKEYDMEVIPGIEISAEYEEDMHILGYYIDINSPYIIEATRVMKNKRDERNDKMIEAFNKLGVSITLKDVKKYASGDVLGKPHFAKALLEKGYIKEYKEAFIKYFKNEELSKIKREMLTPKESIELIINSGGIPVLAHPKSLKLDFNELEEKIIELKSYGLKGIECIYSWNTPLQILKSIEIAKKHNLLITAGTDFHGPSIDSELELGRGINGNFDAPYELLEEIKKHRISKVTFNSTT
ncbi:MAG TPA: phosphoesterase [Clostridiales bacterium]|nr:MAG: hypothetical protein A2Y22_08175 [Clostridiales bacterium GWD2_32_59]HAN09068.1 phosphoesterase [Clostridiales bacterium]